ncbi:MAG: hypothetical protein LV481_15670, partial [Methylacidiphilales bacterium]|nr:hypothetical protein [Candidatus Methylacidiphilales bacterium]
ELAQLDNQEKQQVAFIENDLDSILALLKLENTELQTKIAKQTKVLAGLNDQYNSLKMEMDGSDGVRAAVDGARLEQLNNQMTEIAGQTSRIEAELKNDKATLNEQLALLQKPRSEQLSRLESQISLRFDERRRVIKQKLMQLQVGISK